MLEYTAQISKADVEDHTHRINFYVDDDLTIETKFRLDNAFYFGFAGDIKVIYSYDKKNEMHLAEIYRIKKWIDSRSDIMFEYEMTDTEFTIIIDYDDFPKNEIYPVDNVWISDMFEVTVDSYQKPALFGRIFVEKTNGKIDFKHCILNNSVVEFDNDNEKTIITYGDPCIVNDKKKFEQTPIAPIEGKVTISTTGTTYICVLENDH